MNAFLRINWLYKIHQLNNKYSFGIRKRSTLRYNPYYFSRHPGSWQL